MKVEEIRKIIRVSTLGVLALAVTRIYLFEHDPLSIDGWRAAQWAISVMLMFWAFFFRWGWRWPLLRRLFNRPNLNGTWIGMFSTDWKNEKGQVLAPQKLMVVVRQSFLAIHISSYTEKLVAHSYAESLILELERGLRHFAYLYAKDTTCIGEPGNREGAAELRIVDGSRRQLIGRYWSNQKTCGLISLWQAGNEHVSSFEDAIKRWKAGDWNAELS